MGYRAITCCYRSCASVNTERVNTRLPVLSVGALTSACDAIESTLERVIDLRAIPAMKNAMPGIVPGTSLWLG